MTAQTLTLTQFLLDRIAEDEAAARHPRVPGILPEMPGLPGATAAYYNHFRPARVLAECAAKRAIVEWHESTVREGEKFCAECGPPETEVYLYAPGTMHYPCPTLRALASVYADHELYRAEWAL